MIFWIDRILLVRVLCCCSRLGCIQHRRTWSRPNGSEQYIGRDHACLSDGRIEQCLTREVSRVGTWVWAFWRTQNVKNSAETDETVRRMFQGSKCQEERWETFCPVLEACDYAMGRYGRYGSKSAKKLPISQHRDETVRWMFHDSCAEG